MIEDRLEDATQAEKSPSQVSRLVEIKLETDSTLPVEYSNQVQFLATPHEVFLDFFFIEPTLIGDAVAHHRARIAVPLSVLKGFRDALSQQIANYENEGRVLPNLRSET